jgi:hypothetical protein
MKHWDICGEENPKSASWRRKRGLPDLAAAYEVHLYERGKRMHPHFFCNGGYFFDGWISRGIEETASPWMI